MKPAPLPVGTPVNYGLWDKRQIPCTVTELGRNRLPSVLTVSKTIDGLCKEGATITLEPEFWADLPKGNDWREIRPGVWFLPMRNGQRMRKSP